MKKSDLKEELIGVIAADLVALEKAHQATVAGATHAEAKPENDKDTRALEQQYLARGQAMRAEAVREGLAAVKIMTVEDFASGHPVGVGALVTVEEVGKTQRYLIAMHGGGVRLAEGAVLVVTPKSPLGEVLVGKQAGDVCELNKGGRRRELELVAVN